MPATSSIRSYPGAKASQSLHLDPGKHKQKKPYNCNFLTFLAEPTQTYKTSDATEGSVRSRTDVFSFRFTNLFKIFEMVASIAFPETKNRQISNLFSNPVIHYTF
jgi:hypothetical protein